MRKALPLSLLAALAACSPKKREKQRVASADIPASSEDQDDEPEPETGPETEPEPEPEPEPEYPEPLFFEKHASLTCDSGEDCRTKGLENFELGGVDKDREVAFMYFYRGCVDYDFGPSCRELYFMMRMLTTGYTSTERTLFGHRLLAKGCRAGDGLSCDTWIQYAQGSDREFARTEAAKLLEEGCAAKDQEQCLALSDHVEDERAAQLRRSVCDTLVPSKPTGMERITAGYACEMFAVNARDGEGVPKSDKLYKKYLAKSCKVDKGSCKMHTGLVRSGG